MTDRHGEDAQERELARMDRRCDSEDARTAATNEVTRTCACVSLDARRCLALRHPAYTGDDDDTDEWCECQCHYDDDLG
jgi:hypothetical protein